MMNVDTLLRNAKEQYKRAEYTSYEDLPKSPDGGTGLITLRYTVWCHGCYQWEDLESTTKRAANIEAKARKWTLKKRLWYCPECSKKMLIVDTAHNQKG